MALDLHLNFATAQYLENKLTEFHQILYMHSYCQDLGWYCYLSYLLIFTSAVYIQVHFRLEFLMEANNMNPDLIHMCYHFMHYYVLFFQA